ncbi:GNAT family N-acetyltransferase [Nanoarchaeota archaeon]
MIHVRVVKKADVPKAVRVIRAVFGKFLVQEHPKKISQWYLDFYDMKKNEKKIYDNFQKTTIKYFAEENGKAIGMIRGTPGRITNLYILGKHHRKGIGEKLLARFEKEAKRKGSKQINIRASKFATKFYQKHEYKKTTGMRKFRGMNVQPMKKVL